MATTRILVADGLRASIERLAGALSAAVALGLGCASAPPPSPVTPAAAAASSAAPATAGLVPAPPSPTTAAAIRRADLERVLARSPGLFLAHVDTSPTFRASRFAGWRVNTFFPDDPQLAGALRPGDVITRVNGRSVEQPEQFIQVWEDARFRRDLSVELLRDGVPRRLVWPIVD